MPLNKFPVLAPGYVLRKLEAPYVYNIPGDQLYELDEEAFEFLKKCSGRNPLSKLLPRDEDKKILEYMLDEGIVRMAGTRRIRPPNSPTPSLRYLLLNITKKCNLACRHCYLGVSANTHMKPSIFEKAVSQFEDMGGLKLMVSGGEPLLHPEFWKLMEFLTSFEFRMVLLSNGTLIDKRTARKLSSYVHEVQVSIDGISSHDLLRGRGSYDKAMHGVSNLKSCGIQVSIATMIHRYNASEFEEMQKLFSDLEVVSWNVDVPCVAGNLKENKDYVLDARDAAVFLKYGFGAGGHESSGDYTCGSHLCAVSPDGNVNKCGFFEDEPVGDVNNLWSAWAEICKKYLWTLDKLDCHDCMLVRECRGGCRFRARQYKGLFAPDPVLCHANGIIEFL